MHNAMKKEIHANENGCIVGVLFLMLDLRHEVSQLEEITTAIHAQKGLDRRRRHSRSRHNSPSLGHICLASFDEVIGGLRHFRTQEEDEEDKSKIPAKSLRRIHSFSLNGKDKRSFLTEHLHKKKQPPPQPRGWCGIIGDVNVLSVKQWQQQ